MSYYSKEYLMKLRSILLKNFRLIENQAINLETTGVATILVGPNNSGKTSVAEAIAAFVDPTGRGFSIDDFSALTHTQFRAFEAICSAEGDLPEELPPLPTVSMDLSISYADTPADNNVAGRLMMDLNETITEVGLRIEFAPAPLREVALAFRAALATDGELTLRDYLRAKLSTAYALRYSKLAADGTTELIPRDEVANLLQRLIRVDFLPAQRHMEDRESTQQATRLSRLLNSHYEHHYKTSQPDGYAALELVVKANANELTEKYKDAFAELKAALEVFGYAGTPELTIRAELSANTLFADNTRVYYTSELDAAGGAAAETYLLPERYNGLGFKNLIYMVLQLKAFRDEAADTEGPRPRIHLVIVEEPEAHLHPQMQTVFLSKAATFLQSAEPDGAQLIITTHSSHIVASSGFTPVRYFRRRGPRAVVKDLMAFKSGLTSSEDKEAFEFVTQYLTVVRCDLFFCDKAIMVEGAVERLLLPKMIELVATPGLDLTRSYLSVVEVGGAYAHIFKDFLKFLQVPTLVITDLDAVGDDKKKCRVAGGTSTSNATLKQWLPKKTPLADIRGSTDAERTDGLIRVTFQVPEVAGGDCARSFEEAFCYANAPWLIANKAKLRGTGGLFTQADEAVLVAAAYELTFPKVDFALDLMLNPGWQTPKYIGDGLNWLAGQTA
jgi:predicted ATP-dependent endonuclease of OLD family